jgi:hypothetical protein
MGITGIDNKSTDEYYTYSDDILRRYLLMEYQRRPDKRPEYCHSTVGIRYGKVKFFYGLLPKNSVYSENGDLNCIYADKIKR